MDLDSLEELANLILKDLIALPRNTHLSSYPHLQMEMKNLMMNAAGVLPDHKGFSMYAMREMDQMHVASDTLNVSCVGLSIYSTIGVVEHLLKIMNIEKVSKEKTKLLKIFDSADEKMKQAGLCFHTEDYPSVFHNLNTALELVLKDKLGIPTTIKAINTSNLIDILAKYKIDHYLYLIEARKYVLTIDNKSKHQGFSPSKIDCINGIKAMEELISKLRDTNLKLSEEIRNKLLEGL